jgi:L-malate glycosyltransferase
VAQRRDILGRYEEDDEMVTPNSTKSICFLTNTYPDFDTSYRGIFIRRMAGSLHDEGYGITVVTPKIYRDSRFVEKTANACVYRFPFFSGNRLLVEHEKIPYVRMGIYFLTGFLFTLYALMKHKCDLIHVHWAIPTGLIGVFCAAILRKPLLITIHGSDFRLATKGPGLLKQLFRWVCTEADHVTCVSEELKEGTEGLGIASDKISMFPMGADEKFLNVGKNRSGIEDKGPFTILSNRNLLPLYNVRLLIQAIPMILEKEPKTRFLIAGDGTERDNLTKEAKHLNVEQSIQFLGRLSHDSMPELLARCDVYVSTSLSDGTSVSLLEAMAAGSFPIVTAIPSNFEWIKDGENGFLVPVDGKEILAKRIVTALRNKALLERSREDNLRIVEKRALWSGTIESVKTIYEEILNLKGHKAWHDDCRMIAEGTKRIDEQNGHTNPNPSVN